MGEKNHSLFHFFWPGVGCGMAASSQLQGTFNVLGEEVVAVGWDRGRPGEGRVGGIYPLPLTYSLTLGAACQNSSRALAKGNMARFPGVATTGS